MALSAFDDKTKPPKDAELAATLGKTYVLWNELKKRIASRFTPLSIEWGFSSKATGWGLRLKQEKRAVLYMTPCKGYFLASFALGEKAVKAARESGLPAPVLAVIESAKKYAEGRGVRLEVRTAQDVRNVEKLAAIKMAN
jgi:flavoprotein